MACPAETCLFKKNFSGEYEIIYFDYIVTTMLWKHYTVLYYFEHVYPPA